MRKQHKLILDVLQHAFQHGEQFIAELDDMPVGGSVSKSRLSEQLAGELPERGIAPTEVIDQLVDATAGGLLGSRGGRFYGWVIGGSLPAAQAADLLASVWDQNAALHATGPAVAVIEEVCGVWLKDLLGLPATASFALVTGCQMSHFTCLAAARNRVLADADWDVEQNGLTGAPPIRVLTGNHCHGSTLRAIRQLGLGSNSVVPLELDVEGRLPESTLHAALREYRDHPKIVILQAGDINLGVFDPFEQLIPLAHQHDAWVHIDGAFGLWATASPEYRQLTSGVGQADSWSTDGHKWLNVPYDCGYAFVRDATAQRNAMSQRASYLTHDDEFRDQMDWNPEWSRRSRGVATYAALRELGRQGVANLIERTCHHAQALTHGIAELAGAELVWPRPGTSAPLNQGLVRFPDPQSAATRDDHARHTDAVIRTIQQQGEAFFTGTTWNDQRCMRISVCNWETDEGDVQRSIAAVRQALATCSGEPSPPHSTESRSNDSS